MGRNNVLEWFLINYPTWRDVRTGMHKENIAHTAIRYGKEDTLRMIATKFPELVGEDRLSVGGTAPRDLAKWFATIGRPHNMAIILDEILGPRQRPAFKPASPSNPEVVHG